VFAEHFLLPEDFDLAARTPSDFLGTLKKKRNTNLLINSQEAKCPGVGRALEQRAV
jgi:hypothetical protein